MARQESGKVKIFCLTGVKKNDTEPVSQKHVHFMEREPPTFIETKQICEPILEWAPHEDLSDGSSSFLGNVKDKNRVRPNLKKIVNILESWSRKIKSASHLRRRDQVRVGQRCKSETDLMNNFHELKDCHNDDLKHASDQPQQSDRIEDNYEFMMPFNHNERTVQEKINRSPSVRSLRKEIPRESNSLIVNKAHVSTHPVNPNPRYSHESGPSSGRKELNVTRKNEIRDIRYENRLTEVKKLSPKAMMLRGILNKIRIAGTENVIETTAEEQQRENIAGNIDKQEPETDDDLAEFLCGVDGQGLEQFFSFCDKMLLSENRRYSFMTASEFAAKRKKTLYMSHTQGNATVQGLTSVNLNCKTSPQPNIDFRIKNPQPQLSSTISSTDESSLEFDAPFSSTPVIAGSFRGRLYNPHISGIFIDPDATDTEHNDIGQSFNVQPTSACTDLSSNVIWRSDYTLPPNTKCRDYIPKISKCDRKSVNDIGKTDIVVNNPSQIRRQTKDFVRSSTGVPNSIDERTEQKRSSYNYTMTTCDVNQRLFDEDERRPVSGVLPALKLRENGAELYNDWDYMKYPIHDSDSGCGYSMNSESVFLGNI